MKICKILNRFGFILYIVIFCNPVQGQKTNTDSLLTVIVKDLKNSKNYEKNVQRALLGKKIAPDYLDFYLMLGRNYDLLKIKDSASFYYKYVIVANPEYEDAFLYLINMNIENKNFESAMNKVDNAIIAHPDKKYFYLKKAKIYELQEDENKEYEYLKNIQQKFPEEDTIKQRILILETKFNSDRAGINYTLTTFNREQYGPWHLGSLEYIKQRRWGSLIGRVSYANRIAGGKTIVDGIQYEAESYFFTGKKSYSYIAFANSPDIVFPKNRLGYSWFYNFKKGWEADLGFRYIEVQNADFKTAVLGVGKYIGSYWINLRTFIQSADKKVYPAITLTSRYYFQTRFDYVTAIVGYGTSPDERATLGQFEQRVGLNSYRFGAGYFKMFTNHYITGIQTFYNNQEYAPNKKQNELEISLLLQYKF